MMQVLNSIYTIILDTLIPLVIMVILFIPFIVLDKYTDYRREKERLGRKWKKLQERIGNRDIKALIPVVADKLQIELDTKYPLIDKKGRLLKHQPLGSKVLLKHLEKHINEELGYLPQPVRPDAFIKRQTLESTHLKVKPER